ncbi:MAG: hypothetical protein R6X07_11010 [Desulfatiglandales bacterium]
MDLYYPNHHIVALLPKHSPFAVSGVIRDGGHVESEVGLAHQDGFHVMKIFQHTFHLQPDAPDIGPWVFRSPALLRLNTPSHCLEWTILRVFVVHPGLARRVVFGSFRKSPGDLVLGAINDAGRDSLDNQSRRFSNPIDGTLKGIWETEQDGLDHFFAGVLQNVLFDLNGHVGFLIPVRLI